MRKRKGELSVDYIIAMGIFIVVFAFALYYLTNYVSITSSSPSDIRNKGLQAQTILFNSEGLPSNWEKTNNTARVGLVKKLYRVPIHIYTDTNRTNWPVELVINFSDIPFRRAITLTNISNSRIPVQVENVSEPVDDAYVYFVTNLSTGRNVFYIYYSDQNTTDPNYSGMNLSGSSFASDCSKRIDNKKLVFHLCKGANDNNGPGIRSLNESSQNVEVADNKSIDQIYTAGDLTSGNIENNFTIFEEGPIFAKYRLSAANENTTILANYTFYNGTSIWKTDVQTKSTNNLNKTTVRVHPRSIFDRYQNHNMSASAVLPSTLTYNITNYTVAINSTNNYVLATAIWQNNSMEVGWNTTYEPEIKSLSAENVSLTIWHSYQSGDINTSKDLFSGINVTVLSPEIINSIGFEKINGLSGVGYDTARSSLDMGLDNFFIKITNSTDTIFSYGPAEKKRDVYVESGKTLMQKQNGDIEFVTYTLGVWR